MERVRAKLALFSVETLRKFLLTSFFCLYFIENNYEQISSREFCQLLLENHKLIVCGNSVHQMCSDISTHTHAVFTGSIIYNGVQAC